MGVIYYVICKTCKQSRDIDKNMGWTKPTPKTREEALNYAKNLKEQSFRSGLLLSFLIDHCGHDVELYNDYEENEENRKIVSNTCDDRVFWWGGE